MPSTCERLPVELWHEIIRHALWHPLVDLDDQTQPQNAFQQIFRSNAAAHRKAQEAQEVTRRSLRIVCSTWRTFTDIIFGGWAEVSPGVDRAALYSSKFNSVSRIDCVLTPEHGAGRRDNVYDIDRTHRLQGRYEHKARILTLNSAVSSIDSFLQHHGHLFPSLQVLDLRPASTFLSPKGGVTAGPTFFSTLSTLFPTLSTLLIDLPGSGTPDVLTFPLLRRLSYNIIGQPRLTDWQRCARMEEWNLPAMEHISLNPVGCQEDWNLMVLSLKSWGGNLKSLCWEAECPDSQGIVVGSKDWSAFPQLNDVGYDVKVVKREAGNGCVVEDTAVDTPDWHPFHRIALFQVTPCSSSVMSTS